MPVIKISTGIEMIRIIMSLGLLLSINLFADLVDEGLVEYKNGNIELARDLYIKACSDGSPNGSTNGCLKLGVLYYTGNGVEKDKIKARKLFAKACKSRSSRGCFSLGLIYNRGDEVKQDQLKAKYLFYKACEGGYMGGCEQYTILENKGIGISKSLNSILFN
jgi:TPR repeat protein